MANGTDPDNVVALPKYPDIEVGVYEAAKEFDEVGAGIGVWPRVWKILAYLFSYGENDCLETHL